MDADAPPKKGKFFSRVLGIFSEEIVRLWAADTRAPYRDLGRPRLFCPDTEKGYSLDFTLQHRETGKCFATEMKCEIEYQNYKFLTLREPSQLEHHKKTAFDLFRALAKSPESTSVNLAKEPIQVDGAILVWGDVSAEGRTAVKDHFGFHDVLSLSEILDDLWIWRPPEFEELVSDLGDWSFELFNFLGGGSKSHMQIFKNEEHGYITWRDQNPEGFVCNTRYPNLRDSREYRLQSIVIHKANCSGIGRNKNGEQPWTNGKYFKLCARDVNELERWIRKNVDSPENWQPRRCSRCKP